MNESGWRKKQIADLQAGADIHAGDGGYRIGNAEDHAAFVAERNKSLINERIRELAREAGLLVHNPTGVPTKLEKFAELIVRECIGILETEIELVKGYKSTACNDFDVRWHEGKIEHFAKLVEKSKKHFGVEE